MATPKHLLRDTRYILDKLKHSGVSGHPEIMEQKEGVDVSECSSRGSPGRKCRAGMGELLLSFRKPLMTLLWKILRDLVVAGQMGREDNPDKRTGRL